MYSDGKLPLQAREALSNRLAGRRAEIQPEIMMRVSAVHDPTTVPDPEYAHGLRTAVSDTIDFAIAAIAGENDPRVPLSLCTQARLAARNRIGLETALRRYLAGISALIEVVDRECEEEGIAAEHAAELRRQLRRLLEGLIDEIGREHAVEAESRSQSRESRRLDLVEGLLVGEAVDTTELAYDYDFDSWHIGMIATGAGAADAIRDLARVADRRPLQVCRGEHTVWAWLGGRSKLDAAKLQLLAADCLPDGGGLALGESCEHLEGWRQTHRQAAAALEVGLCRRDRIVRYGEVPVEASLLQDPVRAASLRQRYLVPLEGEPDGGEKSRETLHAYFSRERNVKATATALGIVRQTASCRLRAIEARLGSDLHACAHELEAALALDRLDRRDHTPGP